MYNNAVKKTKE